MLISPSAHLAAAAAAAQKLSTYFNDAPETLLHSKHTWNAVTIQSEFMAKSFARRQRRCMKNGEGRWLFASLIPLRILRSYLPKSVDRRGYLR